MDATFLSGVPLIRDYPASTLAQARYSWALLKRDMRAGLLTKEEYERNVYRVLAAIAKFINQKNQGGGKE